MSIIFRRANKAHALCAALAAISSAAAADVANADCADATAGASETNLTLCDLSPPPQQLVIDGSTGATVAGHAYATPWIAQGSNQIPVTLNATDTAVSLRMSLDALRDYNSRAAMRTIDTSSVLASPVLAMPKGPAAPRSPFDVWSSVDVGGFADSKNESLRTGLGADYKPTQMTSFGVAVERGDARSATSSGAEENAKASAYVTLQAMPALTVDARTEWQSGNAEFAATSGAAEKAAVILAPKINHSFALDGGTTIAPFITYKREFDLGISGREAGDAALPATQSAGGGMTYTKPDAYSLSITADVDGLSATEPESVNGKVQLSVPLK
jgi:hypothetical protein